MGKCAVPGRECSIRPPGNASRPGLNNPRHARPKKIPQDESFWESHPADCSLRKTSAHLCFETQLALAADFSIWSIASPTV